MVRDEQRYEKTLTLKMTEEEHAQIKKLAAERRQSIKKSQPILIFLAKIP